MGVAVSPMDDISDAIAAQRSSDDAADGTLNEQPFCPAQQVIVSDVTQCIPRLMRPGYLI